MSSQAIMNLLGYIGSSMVISRLGGDINISITKKSLVHDSGVCGERALLIVPLRALAV